MRIKLLLSILLLTVLIGAFWYALSANHPSSKELYIKNGVAMKAKTEGKKFYIYDNGKFHHSFLTGVNLGATIPGSFPGELAISKETYLRWFGYIHEMNADVIRVYTTMMPHFYEALYEFNQDKAKPLYLMQGVWLNEYDAKELGDAFGEDRRLLESFLMDATDLVDIIHGNATLQPKPGFAHGTYTANVSSYVIGWILGVEWDPYFVKGTNENNPSMTSYDGNYLVSKPTASPFEIFLTEVGDRLIAFEVDQYDFMRPLSYTNWLTTDHLIHPNEPDQNEDLVSVNTENITASKAFTAGLFASYHIYPYYPEFINYSVEYSSYIDKRGNINPYKAYLDDLYNQLSVPVLVAEFGIPSSRGKTHEAIHSGFNQGFISEEVQGQMVAHMLEDIYDASYMGGFVFSWQDEWFKRTWNTMDFDMALRRPFWSNAQTNEQHFGLLAFDPGESKSIRYVDGQFDDWRDSTSLFETDQLSLHVAYDERYVYLYLHLPNYAFETDRLIIPIMTNRDQGNTHLQGTEITFSHGVDFLIDIQGEEHASILVDPYYDPFYYLYHETLNILPQKQTYRQKNTGMFVDMYQALSNELYLPQTGATVPFSKHLTGKLTYGIANPSHESYQSLADFYHEENHLEIKIPWQLLNISDPSSKMMLSDLYSEEGFSHEPIEGMFIGAYIIHDAQTPITIDMHATTWQSWQTPTYHERLKPSYNLLKETFSKYK